MKGVCVDLVLAGCGAPVPHGNSASVTVSSGEMLEPSTTTVFGDDRAVAVNAAIEPPK